MEESLESIKSYCHCIDKKNLTSDISYLKGSDIRHGTSYFYDHSGKVTKKERYRYGLLLNYTYYNYNRKQYETYNRGNGTDKLVKSGTIDDEIA